MKLSPWNLKANLRALTQRPPQQIAFIDGLRAISVFFVLLFHCFFLPSRALAPHYFSQFLETVPWWLTWVWHGDKGVDTFFVISGFLVGSILMKEDRQTSQVNLKKFYLRRIFRIWPAYWLLLALYLLGDPTHIHYLWASLLFVNNFISSEHFIAPWTWSITVEMQFYLLFPPFYVLVLRRSRHKFTWLIGLFIAANVIMLLITAANPDFYRIPLYKHFFNLESGTALAFADAIYLNLYTRAGPFILGLILALLWTNHRPAIDTFLKRYPSLPNALLALGFFLIIMNSFLPYHNPRSALYDVHRPWLNFLIIVFNRNLFSLGVALVMWSCLFPRGLAIYLAKLLSHRWLLPFANTSYSIYLFHLPILIVAAWLTYAPLTAPSALKNISLENLLNYPQQILLAMIGFLLSFGFAAVVYVLLEKPLIEMGHRLTSPIHSQRKNSAQK